MRTWFKEARELSQISKKDLAEIVSVDPTYISKLEKGQRDPSVILAMKLGKILDFEWQQFYKELEKEI